MPILELNQISKQYRRATGRGAGKDQAFRALDPTTISIEEGEFVTIVGPSGCGKTTLLKIVQGLVPPTTGERIVEGRPVIGPSPSVATVFQSAALFPWFNVLLNVRFGLDCAGLRKTEAEARAQEEIARVGLAGFEKQFPHELSGGMQQRVNLARAMAVSPKVLLLDEPYAALDPQTRDDMQAELLRIWDLSRKTVLMITHQIDEAVYLSDRVLVMSPRPGRIVADVGIDLPRPRGLEVKHTPEFQQQVDDIWRKLRAVEQETSGQEASSAVMH